jgi:hypothetical protein
MRRQDSRARGAKKGAVYLVDKLLAGKKMELFLVLRCRWTCEVMGRSVSRLR